MSEIEKMQKYIERANPRRDGNYSMRLDETSALVSMTAEKPIEAILLAFKYGKAKGYRAAKAEVRA